MLILNFSHPLSAEYIAGLETALGCAIDEVREVPCGFAVDEPFAEQARRLVDSAGLTAKQWHELPLIVNLPSFSVIAALVLAEIHGRRGGFLRVLRSRRDAARDCYVFAEIVPLQAVRENARSLAVAELTREAADPA